jgi:hypothetical protein
MIDNKKAKAYVGGVRTRTVHTEDCEFARSLNTNSNLVWFGSVEDAYTAEYVACRLCHPERD